MRISRVEIERFCGIKNLDVEIENNLQLVAGPNNSCKSTMLKAIDFFFANFDGVEASQYEPQNDYYKQETKSTTKIRVHFKELCDQEMAIFVHHWLPKKKEIWFELRLDRKGVRSYFSSGDGDPKDGYDRLQDFFQVIYVPAVRAGTSDLRANETRKLFLTTKSVLAKKKRGKLNTLQKNFAIASDAVTKILDVLLEESRSQISESLPSESEIKFRFPSSDEILDLLLSKTTVSTRVGTNLTIEDEGTGYQSLLSLGLLKYIESIRSNENLLFLVEEPEAFLHPQYQRAVSDYLKLLARKSQVIVSTHSSVIVDSVELSHINRLIKGANGLTYKWKWEPEDLQNSRYLSRYCDAKNSEIIFADKVILCEGITDKNVICEIYRQIFRSEHHTSNISVISGDGSAIAHIAHLVRFFSIKNLILIDKDAYSDKRDTLKRICKQKQLPLTDADYRVLDLARDTICNNQNEANTIRDSVNNLLQNRGIFVLGADVEASVTHSFSKNNILRYLGPDNLGHIKSEAITELSNLSGEAFVTRINQLIGSKGWNTIKNRKDNKPKPHVLHNLISLAGIGAFKANSDMNALSLRIKEFVES